MTNETSLKNLALLNQNGGNKKIFNLNKKYSEFKKGSLQKNLDKFYKEYGSNIIMMYDKIQFTIICEKVKLLTGITIYRMKYDIPHRTTHLLPFIIDFYDPIANKKNNNSYISNIQKTNTISGSQMVKICIAINKILGANKIYLIDAAHITCKKNYEELDLSLIKLIDRNNTFYMNLGFDFEQPDTTWYSMKHSNKNELKNDITNLIKKIRCIKTEDIITEYKNILDLLVKMIKDNYKGTFDIIKDYSKPISNNEIYDINPHYKIVDLFNEAHLVLNILNKYKSEKFLYKILVKTFKNECNDYSILNKYLIENRRTKIIYNKTIIERKYTVYFSNLIMYRQGIYSYTL